LQYRFSVYRNTGIPSDFKIPKYRYFFGAIPKFRYLKNIRIIYILIKNDETKALGNSD
jgi:hypothetical protein